MKQTIILDFDGVLHSYSSGWQGAACAPDPPTPGAKEGVARLREKYQVVVCSSRCHQPGGTDAIRDWLAQHGIEVDLVTSDKPPHVVVVDDRALRFEGDWQAVLDGVAAASVPWNKKTSAP
jgi:ribonucleotide monophosphatase NagD (HAD superfamily)